MRTVAQYTKHAEDCRKLAKRTPNPEDRRALEDMARLWERLAEDRRRSVERERAEGVL
jgi:hypothetical protein